MTETVYIVSAIMPGERESLQPFTCSETPEAAIRKWEESIRLFPPNSIAHTSAKLASFHFVRFVAE